jgi:hypothetical protein
MNQRSRTLLLWSPRILAILVCLFLGLFALDAFGNGKSLREALPDFATHIAPMLGLLAVAGVSWRWEWVGALVFTGLSAAYAYVARDHVSWVLSVSGPLLLVGVLFFWSWLRHEEIRSSHPRPAIR